jgi:hypothetical protein
MKRLLALSGLLFLSLLLMGVGQLWPDTLAGTGSPSVLIKNDTSVVVTDSNADGTIWMSFDSGGTTENIGWTLPDSPANQVDIVTTSGTDTIRFDGNLSVDSLTVDPSESASMLLETLTNSLQVKIDIVDSDPDSVMRLKVDEDDNLVEYLHLDGANDRVEAKEMLAAEAGLTVTAGGAGIALSDTATECVVLSAYNAVADVGSGSDGSTVAGTNFDYYVQGFQDTVDEQAHWLLPIPASIAGTTAVVTPSWTAPACTVDSADDVCWVINGGGFQENEAFKAGALSGTATAGQSTCATADYLEVGPAITWTHGFDVAAPKDTSFTFQITRDANLGDAACDGDDNNISGDVNLVSVQICYEVENVFSGE